MPSHLPRPRRLPRARWLAALLAALLPAGARAADVVVLGTAQSVAEETRTLRIPRTGTFDMAFTNAGYLTVGLAISDIANDLITATWTSTRPGAEPQALEMRSSRHGDGANVTCRTQVLGLAGPAAGPGFVTITVRPSAGTAPPPSLAGTLIAFGNVASTSTGGPCCMAAANDGQGTTTITKTMFDTSRGDALVNSVCTTWTGAAPGMPRPDPDGAPEMVARSFLVTATPRMQHFTGTSPGGEADRPATKYRHLRWAQSGDRVWALAGLMLFATDTLPPPPDASSPPPDATPPLPPDAAPTPPRDAAPPPADVTPPPIDVTAPPLPEPSIRLDGGLIAAPEPDAGTAPEPVEEGGDAGDPLPADATINGPYEIDLRVGCACELSSPARAGGPLSVLVIALTLLLRSRRRGSF
jgi:hypothetical protein